MNASFDKFSHFNNPTITLCYPGTIREQAFGKMDLSDTRIFDVGADKDYILKRSLGQLVGYRNLKTNINFNAQWEMSFDYSSFIKDEIPITASLNSLESTSVSLQSLIKERMLLYVSGLGFFVITGVTKKEVGNKVDRAITAISIDEELKSYDLPYIPDGAYALMSYNNENTIIKFLVDNSSLGNWGFDYIDDSLLGVKRYFENVESKSVYEFLWNDIQSAFNCIVVPNYKERTISIYSRDGFVKKFRTGITLKRSNVIDETSVSSDTSNSFTAIKAGGQGDLSVSWVNPMGTNVLYDFSNYYNWMSPQLAAYVKSWSEYIDILTGTPEHPGDYVNKNGEYLQALTNRIVKEAELEIAQAEYNVAATDYNSVINTGIGSLSASEWQKIKDSARAAMDAAKTKLSSAKLAYNAASAIESQKKDIVAGIIESCQFKNWFKQCIITASLTSMNLHFATEGYIEIRTKELYNELINYIFPCEYTDEHLIETDSMTYQEILKEAFALAKNAKEKLKLASGGIRKISVDTTNFIFDKEFSQYTSQLAPGCILNCEVSKGVTEELQCCNIIVDYEEKNVSFDFADKTNKYDIKTLYDEVLGSVTSSLANIANIENTLSVQQKTIEAQGVTVNSLKNKAANQGETYGAVEIGKIPNGSNTTTYGLGSFPIYQKSLVLDWANKTYYRKSDNEYIAITQNSYESSHNSEIYYYDSTLEKYLPVFDWGGTTYYLYTSSTYSTVTKSAYEANLSRAIYYNKVTDYHVKLTKAGMELGGFNLTASGTGTHIDSNIYANNGAYSQLMLLDAEWASGASTPYAIWMGAGASEASMSRKFAVDYEGNTYIGDKIQFLEQHSGSTSQGYTVDFGTFAYTDSGANKQGRFALYDSKRAGYLATPYAIWLGTGISDFSAKFSVSYKGKTYIADGSGTFTNSSDRDVKNSIESLDERYDKFFDELKPCRYKYNSEENGKYHTGFVAQDVKTGLDSSQLKESDFFAYIDDHGEEDPGTGAKFRLAQDEFISLCVWQIQKLKQEVAELKNEISKNNKKDEVS